MERFRETVRAMNVFAIKDAIRKVKAAKKKLSATVAKAFPVGSDIHWEKHGHRQHGTVLNHGETGRLRVQNAHTGKNYWIGMYDIFGYIE